MFFCSQNISIFSYIFIVNILLNIFNSKYIHINIHMNIHMTSDCIARTKRLAWTRKLDENLKQGWSDEDDD